MASTITVRYSLTCTILALLACGERTGGFSVAPEVGAGGPLVVLYATNLEEIETRIREYGGRIVRETFEFPGGRRFHFTDPSGNELAVWSDR